MYNTPVCEYVIKIPTCGDIFHRVKQNLLDQVHILFYMVESLACVRLSKKRVCLLWILCFEFH